MSDPRGVAPIEKASIDELRSLQLERLRKTLQHTYRNVAFFRDKCEAAGVVPDDNQSILVDPVGSAVYRSATSAPESLVTMDGMPFAASGPRAGARESALILPGTGVRNR